MFLAFSHLSNFLSTSSEPSLSVIKHNGKQNTPTNTLIILTIGIYVFKCLILLIHFQNDFHNKK